MKRKRVLRALLVCATVLVFFAMPVNAANICNEYIWLEDLACELVDPANLGCWEECAELRTQGSMSGSISENSIASLGQSISLQANDFVTFNCSYSPSSASMDFGVIASNGRFYYINVKEGSINQAIRISQSGSYTVAVRNNSSQAVRVVGFVDY